MLLPLSFVAENILLFLLSRRWLLYTNTEQRRAVSIFVSLFFFRSYAREFISDFLISFAVLWCGLYIYYIVYICVVRMLAEPSDAKHETKYVSSFSVSGYSQRQTSFLFRVFCRLNVVFFLSRMVRVSLELRFHNGNGFETYSSFSFSTTMTSTRNKIMDMHKLYVSDDFLHSST